jgi:hypothetical protein
MFPYLVLHSLPRSAIAIRFTRTSFDAGSDDSIDLWMFGAILGSRVGLLVGIDLGSGARSPVVTRRSGGCIRWCLAVRHDEYAIGEDKVDLEFASLGIWRILIPSGCAACLYNPQNQMQARCTHCVQCTNYTRSWRYRWSGTLEAHNTRVRAQSRSITDGLLRQHSLMRTICQ